MLKDTGNGIGEWQHKIFETIMIRMKHVRKQVLNCKHV